MSDFANNLASLLGAHYDSAQELIKAIQDSAQINSYKVVEVNIHKPWGGYIRIHNSQASMFLSDFFNGLSVDAARFGNPDAELSPKFLIVSPKQRLSLQTHERRAERWKFLTAGYYYKSMTTDAGEINYAKAGEVVQFEKGETHRLCGNEEGFVVVAEIWQHTDPTHLSDEDDITRLEDDYSR